MKEKIIPILFALAISLSLTSCRYRVTDNEPVIPPEPEKIDTAIESTEPENIQEPEKTEEPSEPPAEEPEPDAPSVEDEASDRREYDENASAEVSEDAESYAVADETAAEETAPAPQETETSAEEPVYTETEENTDLTVTENVPAEEADELAASDEGEVAESSFTYYTTLLDSRLNSQFECQKLYAYWETAEDHVTVYKTSREHEIILLAGAYDSSSKLLEDALTVDDGWISRKNPGAIIKVISDDGFSVNAPIMYDEIAARSELSGTDAVKNSKIIILSDSLISTSARRVAAAVYIAKLMYPDKLSDIDADEALALLTGEEGNVLSGTYTYTK